MEMFQKEPIAIIGIGCRFPGAKNPVEFWRLLRDGRNAISEVPKSRWQIDAIYDTDPDKPGKTISRWGGFIDNVDQFDWRTFHILPREAKYIDPQHRLLLEVAWEAFEDAGLPLEEISGSRTSVSIGIAWNDYLRLQTRNWSKINGYTIVGNPSSFAANRLSYTFNLKGPSVSHDAGCSSSQASVYFACQSLWAGEASMAVAGGVNLMLSPDNMIMASKAGLLSRDGRCKTLDASADGFVRGEGAGIIVLKPLSQVKASDRVYALIRGVEMNHNGHIEWIMGTSSAAQETLLSEAYRKAGIDPAAVDYVELHGTGFLRGDQVEAAALGNVLGKSSGRENPCLIGSVKTNIGNLESAAGIASIIKVALALYHQQIPPTLNITTVNPGIPLDDLRLAAPQTTRPWPEKTGEALAGVTTLSFTGINAHTVLAAPPTRITYPANAPAENEGELHLLPLSARSLQALVELASAFKIFLETAPPSAWHDICYTASVRRSHHPQRLALTGRSSQEAIASLETWLREQQSATGSSRNATNLQKQKLVFLFSQNLDLQHYMTGSPLRDEKAFQATLEEGDALFRVLLGRSPLEEFDACAEITSLHGTLVHHPLVFLFQIALAAHWQAWGIIPDAVFGEGPGEIAAAYLAGGFTLEEAVRVISHLAISSTSGHGVQSSPEKLSSETFSPKPVAMPLFTLSKGRVETALPLIEAYDEGCYAKEAELSVARIDVLLTEQYNTFLELGSPSVFSGAILARVIHHNYTATLLASFREGQEDMHMLLRTLGTLYTSGWPVLWSELYSEDTAHCVSLPTYPWQRERVWLDWLDADTISTYPEQQGALERESQPISLLSAAPSLLQELRTTSPDTWQERIQFFLTEQVRALLEWEATEELDPHLNLLTAGMDSLLATRLLNIVRQNLECALPPTLIFTCPTIEAMSAYLTRELMSLPQANSDAASPEGTFAPLEEPPTRVPLSLAQQRLWLFEQFHPEQTVYNEFSAFQLTGPFRRDAFERSIQDIVRRHSILRTTFTTIDGEPVQEINTHSPVAVQHVDLRHLAASQRKEHALDLVRAEIRTPLSLEHGPLLKVSVFQLEKHEHILLILFHHLIGDGWSMGLLHQELSSLYAAYCKSYPSPLSALPRQYADFTLWQRQYLQGELVDQQLHYWKKQLAGAPSVLQLPTDRPRPATSSHRGVHHFFTLDATLTQALKRTSQREGVTLFTMLLSALYVLLYRYSHQEDISIGTAVANRDRPEFEKVIGFFINNLVLRASVHGDASFRDFLAHVRNVALEAYAHKDVPFDLVVKELQPQRDPGISPFFQVLFILQDRSWIETQLSGLLTRPLEIESGVAKFDLYLSMAESQHGLRGSLEYNTEIFEEQTIIDLVEHLQVLLAAIARDPSQQIDALPLLTAAESRRLLTEWNATQTSLPLHRPFHALFAEQVERTPDATAVVYKDTTLTYRELNRRANQLAHLLLTRGVGPDRLVGVYMDRGPDMLISMLAIFKAGGAYIPLDPAYPPERLALILKDAGLQLLITHPHLVANISLDPALLLCFETGRDDLQQYAESNPFSPCEGKQLAYVIYTSGSTGRPKGAMVTQDGMLNHLYAKIRDLNIDATQRIAQTASHCFDISVWQFFAALLQGGQVHIIPNELAYDPIGLIRQVEGAGITLLEIVPSLLRALLNVQHMRAGGEAKALALRFLIITGEAFPVDLSQRWFQIYPCIPLVNAYGPTECSDDVTHAFVTKAPDSRKPTIPIGRPILNTQLYILDPRLTPVPVGVAGTLYVGGTGVGRGYLHDPARTASAFLPNPFARQAGERFYCTGDLARYLPDGSIEFLGRTDQQVKMRGFRIELGEIEATILQHHSVQACAVLIREDTPDDKRLVAYVVFKNKTAHAEINLREFLRQQLPSYMVPTAFVALEALPLTANGKIHYQALPRPDTKDNLTEHQLAPRNAFEEIIAGIWKDTLHRERIGISESFFELGGHSLLATQLLARVNAFFQIHLPVRAFFEAPTIEQLAKQVEQALHSDQHQETLPLVPYPRAEQLPVSLTQQRLWFLDQLSPDNPFYNLCGMLHLDGPLNVFALERSIQTIEQRHEALRTTFLSIDGRALQIVSEERAITLVHCDLSHLPDHEQEHFAHQFAAEQAARPFNLAEGPLTRVHLLRFNARKHALVLVMHHIVSDGWSLGVFARELQALYNAFATGQEPLLPDLPVQYGDYTIWQRQRLESQAFQQQLQYWQQQLAGIPALLELPTDRPRPSIQTFHGAQLTFQLSPQQSRELARFSQQEGATLFMTLLATLQTLLYRYTGQEDIVVGTAIANRNQVEVENLIGFFVNTLALRADLSGNPSFRSLLKQVRKVCLDAYTHQDLPFEKVVDVVQPERSLSTSPLFQVMFVLQNGIDLNLDFVDLSGRFENVYNQTAKFDLTITMAESPEGLAGVVEYNTDLFDSTSIEHFIAHFQMLLQGVTANADQALSQAPIFSPAQYQDISTGEIEQPPCLEDLCVQQLFEIQARRAPDSVAIVSQDECLTYAQLDRRANQLAAYLVEQGVQAETVVGLCMIRSFDFLIGLLGVLKAGGAYLPLDPDYPQERLAFLLKDARASLLLTQSHLIEHVPREVAQMICLDTDWPLIARSPEKGLPARALPTNLAYVIYTSGSTGKPKGVQVSHHNLRNLLSWHIQSYSIHPGDRATQVASVAFDACVWEVWPYLVSGACLHLPTEDIRLSATQLRDWLIEQGITISFLPTPLAESIMAVDWPRKVALRTLLTGGDKLQHYPIGLPFRLVNHYGPTEFTVVATAGTVQSFAHAQEADEAERAPSLGHPITNTRIYLLDKQMALVPWGAPGEIYLGGPSLARGYLHRPEWTAERFVPNPFSSEAGARLYRTGDLARYLPNGEIEFMGRIDDQVKVRGYRIEPGEIESTLLQYPGMQDAIVLAREDVPGVKRLVAYIIPQKGTQLQITNVQDFLQARLPDYMVPSFFVELEAFPLTVHGKVDRKALPAPNYAQHEEQADLTTPHNTVEQTLASIWEQVLGIDQVSIHDNFFTLGGDSILSIQIVSRAAQAGIHITPQQFFQHQTIAGLAAHATTEHKETIVAAEDEDSREDIPLTPIQRWFFELEQPEPHYWNQALLLSMRQPVRMALLDQAIKQVLQHHDAFRLRFTREDGQWRQRNGERQHETEDQEIGSCLMVDLTALPSAARKRAEQSLIQELQASLNLESGPIFRAACFTGAGKADHLLIVIHHLLIDGVSWRIVLEDLEIAYTQLAGQSSTTGAPQLPARTNSFQQWAQQLVTLARSEELLQDLPYWLAQSQGDALHLPLDYPGGKNTVASTRRISVSLSREETSALLYEAPAAYHTQINDLLLTALTQTLASWLGRGNLLLDLEGHGRELLSELDISRTVGWFTALYPLRVHLDAASAPVATLKTIKEQLRGLPRKGASYGILRYSCEQPDKAAELAQLRAQPGAEIMFNYRGQFDQFFASSEVFSSAVEPDVPTASPPGKRHHVLETIVSLTNGQLEIEWMYSQNIHRASTIEKLARAYKQALRSLIAHCRQSTVGGYTPSDFPLATLDQPSLDALFENNRQVEALFPLSPLQQGLLFHSLYTPGSGDYIIQVGFTLQGFDLSAFTQAWERLLERHTPFRTAFLWEGLTEPHQVVYRQVHMPIIQQDWRSSSSAEQQELLAAYYQADRERGFTLTESPLMRLAFLRLADDTYQVVWSHHHLLLDGWSVPIVLKELFALYEAVSQGQVVTLEMARPYQDYIAWHRQQDKQKAETFWRDMLRGFSSPTPLNLGSGKEQPQSENYAEQILFLSEDVSQTLQNLARQQQMTLNTLVQGVWALLLSHYSGENDVLFGSVVSGRPGDMIGVEKMVGLFINTLPVRVRLRPNQVLRTWLQELQAQQTASRSYEYSSLAQIQGWSMVPKGIPLFESLVVFENYPLNERVHGKQTAEDLIAQALRTVHIKEQTHYPITLVITPGAQFQLRILFDRGRFSEASIGRLLTHMQQVFSRLPAHLDQPLAALSILSPEEYQQLGGGDAAPGQFRSSLCLHEHFEKQARRAPDAIAVVYEDLHITYQELNRRANYLARVLREQGVGPETFIGLCVERSLDLIIGLLGILKAGGVYVPLDPSYPAERLAFIVDDAQIKIVLTQQHLAASVARYQANMISIDAIKPGQTSELDTNPSSGCVAANAAYSIYTSGSTGKPKGVVVTHDNVTRLFNATHSWFHCTERDIWTLFHSYAFDFSVWEIWGALLYGAKLVVVPYWVSRSTETFYDLLSSEQVTILNQTPSAFIQLLKVDEVAYQRKPLSLRKIIFGGEALELQSLQPWFERHGDHTPELINMYGITETTVHVTYRPLSRDDITRSKGSAIGLPIPDLQIYILDQYGQIAPLETPGEIYVGGAGLARGYLKRPDLTSERFIPNPFSKQPGARLYKTGDLARRLPNGDFEYLGRIDLQVKIRGFRIELGEIEAAITAHPEVRTCIVTVRGNGTVGKRLVAYIVPNMHAKLTTNEMRQWLQQRLPDYMVPSACVFMDVLPLTPNGKVDHQKLPEPNRESQELAADFVAPRTPTEQMLAEIWAQVLRVERVGIHDNFFELGGDSILSIQIVGRASQAGLHLTPKQLFEHQTIVELSLVASARPSIESEQGLVLGSVPLSPIQRWFFEQEIPDVHHWNQSLYLSIPEHINIAHMEAALKALLLHHDALRARFERQAQNWQQTYRDQDEHTRFFTIDLSNLPPAEQERAQLRIEEVVQRSMNLAYGPLLRTVYFKLGQRPQRDDLFLMVIHHLVVDGVSWRILLEDLQTAYKQSCQHETIRLPEKTTSFKQWARHLTEYAQSSALQQESAYWLAPARSSVLPLPVDYAADDQFNTIDSVGTVTLTLSSKETRALLEQLPTRFATRINDVLLTALYQSFAQWTGKPLLLVDLEGHGREELFAGVDLSRTVGWFTSIFPLLLEGKKNAASLVETLKSIQGQLRALPHRGIGYGILRYLSNTTWVTEQLQAQPQAQVAFNYLGTLDQMVTGSRLFGTLRPSDGPTQCTQARRRHLLEVNSWVNNDQFQITWEYSKHFHRRSTIEALANTFMDVLRSLIAQGQSDDATTDATPDILDLDVSPEALEDILAELGLD
jgi:amino acid adenylation domain-containing protein/non-ribosomal peptide synthase protein (TIGR01720 family)